LVLRKQAVCWSTQPVNVLVTKCVTIDRALAGPLLRPPPDLAAALLVLLLVLLLLCLLQAAMDAQAQALIREVWEVVDTNYLDARRSEMGMSGGGGYA
jgi:hypothetical protein